jgi:methyl-accepting chemotaxis protein
MSGFVATFFLMLFTTICLAALETAKSTMLKHIEAERTRVAEEAAKSEALARALAEEKNHIEEKITLAVAASEQQKARLADGVHTILTAMDALAEGDLTMNIAIDGDDEVSQLYQGFNHVAMTFHNMVAEVQDAIHVTANTTAEVNHAATQIAAAVEEQSSQMTHIAAAVEQMFQSVRRNMECASDTSLASKENVQNAQSGGVLMEQMMTKMQQIVSIAQSSEHLVEDLNNRSAEIGEIVSVIHEIADQTNLLALNAAIEAARAGEHGRGFSVVADEVRKLAERTVSATKQISQTVKGIQTQTGTVMQGIRTSNHEVSAGITIAGDASSSFAMIVAGDEVIRMKVEEIASATEQQSSSNQQINSSIQQIAAATEETSVIVHEVSTSTDNLSKRMERLLQLSSVFKTHHHDILQSTVKEVAETTHRQVQKGSSLAQFAVETKAKNEYRDGARRQISRQSSVRAAAVVMQ